MHNGCTPQPSIYIYIYIADNLLDHEILPTGYSIYRKDRSSRGGGVLLAVKNSIHSHALNTPLELEALYVQIGNTDPINYCLVYIPPNSSEVYIQTLCDFLTICSNDKLVLIGDFNFPTINWDILQGETPMSNLFCDLVFNLNLVQMINEPTHIHGNILDLILIIDDNLITSLSVHSNSSLPIVSDHFAMTFSLNSSLPSPSKFSPFYVFNYSKGDYEGLYNHLSNVDFSPCLQSHDIEFIWSFILSTISCAMHQFIP